MIISWTQEMATGVEAIDQQHQELIRQINVLYEALQIKVDKAQIEGMLDFLTQYAKTHFEQEERCMLRFRCPIAGTNQVAHQEFVHRLAGLREQLAETTEEGYGIMLLQLHRFISVWISSHIVRVDANLQKVVTGAVVTC